MTLAASIALGATAANAVTVDGTLDAAYGAAKSVVTFNASAPEGNFGTPTNQSDASGYKIYLTSDANNVYGLLQTFGPGSVVGNFANLYFDLDPANSNGSDVGTEVTNQDIFVPGLSGPVPLSPSVLNYFSGPGVVEFSLANSFFTGPYAGLTYYPGHTFAGVGDKVTLRLSQSFGYSVAGGASYGPDRLGAVTIGGGAVPEPTTWAMMLIGFGGMGAMIRHRKSNAFSAAA